MDLHRMKCVGTVETVKYVHKILQNNVFTPKTVCRYNGNC